MKKNTFIFILFILFFQISCTTGPQRKIETPSAAPELGIVGKNDDLSIKINCVIFTNGPGTWVKDAPWDEYVVTINTPSNKAISINKVALIDESGIERTTIFGPPATTGSEALAQGQKASDLQTGPAYASTATGLAYHFGVASGALQAIPILGHATALLGPASGIAGQSMSTSYLNASIKEKEEIQAEFQKRKLGTPLSLAGDANATGSFFFPPTNNPKALTFEYIIKEKMADTKFFQIPIQSTPKK
jgi:hypothetical protein